MPLVATWCESDELFGKERTYCHTFFGMGDGGALAFFQFADPEDQAEFGPPMPPTPVPSHRPECRPGDAGRRSRSASQKAGNKPPQTYVLEHGYCRSRVRGRPERPDPGVHPRSSRRPTRSTHDRRADAHQELKRWLAGDHTSNNTYRYAE